jgi:hypothetical protein
VRFVRSASHRLAPDMISEKHALFIHHPPKTMYSSSGVYLAPAPAVAEKP